MAEQEKFEVVTPEGRLIHENLWERDKFDEKAVASYKIEMAFDNLDEVEDALARAAAQKWGGGAAQDYFDDRIVDPIIDGNVLLRRREEKGKSGDAYKDKLVIRAHTIFNRDGADAPGGVCVYAPDVSLIEPVDRARVYPGCYGCAKLVIDTYVDSTSQKKALMFYLQAFQMTRDGERLIAAADHSKAFKPVGREEDSGTSRRKARG